MKHKILITILTLCFFSSNFTFAQKKQPTVEITLRDIYEEMKDFRKEIHDEIQSIKNDISEMKQTLVKHDEKFVGINTRFDAVDERFDAVDERLDTNLQIFLVTILLLGAILGFMFVRLSQIGERISSLETLITGDIKPAKQKVMEMAFQKTEEFITLKNESKALKEKIEILQTALKKANIL